jgi:hypothetical protein
VPTLTSVLALLGLCLGGCLAVPPAGDLRDGDDRDGGPDLDSPACASAAELSDDLDASPSGRSSRAAGRAASTSTARSP